MSQPMPESERPWRLYIAAGVFAVLFLAALFFAGRQPEGEDPAAVGAGAAVDSQQQCEEQLAGIMAAVDPRELGLSSKQSDRAHDLNLWLTDCGALFAAEEIAQDAELIRKLLPEGAAAGALEPRFQARDAAHLRTTLLLRQTAQHVIAGVVDPVAQAVAMFDFVQRNVLEVGGVAPTMTPYEVLLIGRGSAEQRAWLLAELLRQIELDAVIVRPAREAADAAADRWLLGVVISAEAGPGLFLFDIVAGVPIPAASEATATTVTVARPATLGAVRADAGLLRQLDAGETPYRFTAEDLAAVRIGLVGNSSLWSNRVATLDFATELRGAIFYDGLGQNRLREPALFNRVARAGSGGGWTESDLFVWELPEAQLIAFGTAEAAGQPLLANYLALLAGPTVRPDLVDPQTGQPITWSHPLIEARHSHITGIYADAIQDYNRIRGGIGVFNPDPLNDLCRESAVYWTTGCQYELGKYDSVVNTASRGSYPPTMITGVAPIWAEGVANLAALALARLGNYAAATTLLSQPRPGVPHGQQYLLRRWERLAAPPTAAPESAPAETPPAAPAPTPAEPASAPSAAETSPPPAAN